MAIIDIPIEQDMKKSYMDYAMSVIVSRALPDVRDGLKPVHRRILYSMHELGNTHSKAYKKSARVVGEVLGKYHPHGDAAIYDSLVRMAQPFSLRNMLVDGQGNFGSIDGDSAAAMRYCISGDSLLLTDEGIVPIKSLSGRKEETIKKAILSFDGKKNKAVKFFNSGKHPVIEIATSQGYAIKGSYNHPVLCWSRGLLEKKPAFNWKVIEKVREGDIVVLQRGHSLFAKKAFPLAKFRPRNRRYGRVGLPAKMNSDLAFLLGALVAEGSFHQNKAIFNNSDMAFYNKIKNAILSQFKGAKLYERRIKGNCRELEIYQQGIVQFLINIGLVAARSEKKEIPFSILQSREEHVSAFLQGLFEGDGSVLSKTDKRHGGKSLEVAFHSKSRTLVEQLKIVLLNFGVTTTFPYRDKRNGCYKLQITGAPSLLEFMGRIGFFSKRKKMALADAKKLNGKRLSKTDYIPHLAEYLRRKYGGEFLKKNNLDRYPLLEKNYKKIAKIADAEDRALLDCLLKNHYFFNAVARVTRPKQKEEVYSIRVDSNCHSFVANAFINHNTEVRMMAIAEELLKDIEKETVGFTPNFDGTLQEPIVLPSRVPNLLVNGSAGIAVGMATNVPPHNLGEIADAIVALIEGADEEKLLSIVPGPDFPTGGYIIGRRGILEAYTTGKGIIRLRGKVNVKEKGLEIIEIPYQVNKTNLIQQIVERVKEKKIEGISGLNDHSDKDGMSITIDLKRGEDPEIVLRQLYANTDLEKSFGIINLALVDGKPRQLTLFEMLSEFVKFRKEIITKRSQFELAKAKDRMHILEGLVVALANIDAIVGMLKAAKNADDAKGALGRIYGLSEKQSAAILDMKLQKLTGMEREGIEKEKKEKEEEVRILETLLADEKKILEVVKREALDIKARFADPRRTEIIEGEEEGDIESLIPDEKVVVTFSKKGYIKRVPLEEYKQQKRGGLGVIGAETVEEDFIEDVIVTTNHKYMLFFTDAGRVHWLKTYRIPESSRYSAGKPIVNLLELKEEKVTAWIAVDEFRENEYLVMATKEGTVTKTRLSSFSRPRKGGIISITLREGDQLIEVRRTDGNQTLLIGTRNGKSIRFHEKDVRETGRSAMGVRGIRLSKGDEVVGFTVCDKPYIITLTENGYGKLTAVEEYRVQSRGGQGIINIKAGGRNGNVAGVRSASTEDEVIVVSSSGRIVRIGAKDISVIGRNTMGVRIAKLKENEKVSSYTVVKSEGDSGGEGAGYGEGMEGGLGAE